MAERDSLADQFEAHRAHLRAVAYRMLGSAGEADDAVQEAWLRLSRTDSDEIENLGGWLTTVVARVSLDMLRRRASRREDPIDDGPDNPGASGNGPGNGNGRLTSPEDEAVLSDAVGSAMLVVLDSLTPAERMAFVLHDMFSVPFEQIGEVLGRSSNAAKQLALRARHKVDGSEPPSDADPARQREVVDAFLAASRNGDFEALVSLLHPDIVLRADPAAVGMGSPEELRGARSVAGMFSGRAQAAQAAVVDGGVGVVWAVRGRPRVVWDFVIEDGKVVHIDMLADTGTLADVALRFIDSQG